MPDNPTRRRQHSVFVLPGPRSMEDLFGPNAVDGRGGRGIQSVGSLRRRIPEPIRQPQMDVLGSPGVWGGIVPGGPGSARFLKYLKNIFTKKSPTGKPGTPSNPNDSAARAGVRSRKSSAKHDAKVRGRRRPSDPRAAGSRPWLSQKPEPLMGSTTPPSRPLGPPSSRSRPGDLREYQPAPPTSPPPPAKAPPQKPRSEGQRRRRSTPLIPGLPKTDPGFVPGPNQAKGVGGAFTEAEKRRLMGPDLLTRQHQLDKLNKPGSPHHPDTRTRGAAASRAGGAEARNRQAAETQAKIEEFTKTVDYVTTPTGSLPRYLANVRGSRAQGKALEFPHNQPRSIGGNINPRPNVQIRAGQRGEIGFYQLLRGPDGKSIINPRFPAALAGTTGASRSLRRHGVPNAPPMVRTPYGSDRVGNAGIPRNLKKAIDQIMKGTGLGLTVTFGIAGVSEAINESRKRGIKMGAWMSGASSSAPAFLGR